MGNEIAEQDLGLHFIKLGDKKNFILKICKLLKSNDNKLSNNYLNEYDWSRCAEIDYKHFKSILNN